MSRLLMRASIATLLAAALLAAPAPQRSRAAGGQDQPIPGNVEAAVDRGLSWLAKSQKPDGSWGDNYQTAITGLSAMAFMARGHTPGQGPYGERLNHAVDFLLASQNGDGVLGSGSQPMYSHGIATMALCEVYGMLDDHRQEATRAAITKAVRLILRAQAVPKGASDNGGWRYSPTQADADLSVSGWQLMALRGAANAGADLPPKAIEDGIKYVKNRAVHNGSGGFAYTGNGGANAALTGTGILTLCLLGQPDDPAVKAGGDFLLASKDLNGRGNNHFYALYYVAQAAWQLGGTYWDQLDSRVRADLLGSQSTDGAWTANEGGGGAAYTTSMAILALTVPYRYLPIYQR